MKTFKPQVSWHGASPLKVTHKKTLKSGDSINGKFNGKSM